MSIEAEPNLRQSTLAISSYLDIKEFCKENVRIRDPERVGQFVKEIINGGDDKLQIIADFDMTLSRFHINGKRCVSTHCALEGSKYMPEECRQKSSELLKIYYPIEMDTKMPFEEKFAKMVEWWNRTHSVLKDCGLKEKDIADIVAHSNTKLRESCDKFLETLHKKNVPVLVFSAGLGDLIVEVFRQQAKLYDNMKVVSNFMDFDENGVIRGFKGQSIHILNKNIKTCNVHDYANGFQARSNVILLGDSPGDITMCEGFPGSPNVLKIGYLNTNIEERLDLFLNIYDVVLIDDQTCDIVNSLLQRVM